MKGFLMNRIALLGTVLAAAATPVSAHPDQPVDARQTATTQGAATPEQEAVKRVLSDYKAAIERRDARGTEQLFVAESSVFESGGSEGTFATYLAHHLGPELGEFRAFQFSDYKVDVHLLSADAAHAIETYRYRIETKAGEIVDRLGVATSVLRKENGTWKILMMHSSSRRPKAS